MIMTCTTKRREARGCDSIWPADAGHAGWNIEPIARADEKMTALRHVEDAEVTSAPVRR